MHILKQLSAAVAQLALRPWQGNLLLFCPPDKVVKHPVYIRISEDREKRTAGETGPENIMEWHSKGKSLPLVFPLGQV